MSHVPSESLSTGRVSRKQMSLQNGSSAMQEVNQIEDSQPPARPPLSGSVRLMISLFRLIFETSKKVVETSRSFTVFLRLSRLVLVATLILTIAMFAYTAFYQSVMPTEVAQ